MDERLIKMIQKNLGEYVSAKKIHETLGISLSFVYSLLENEKIKTRERYGRKEIELNSFLKTLNLGSNIKAVEKYYSKADFDLNNFYNWGPQNEIERYLERLLLDELSYFTCVKELVKLTGVSKSTWHEIMEQGGILYLTIHTRKIIVTQSLLPYFREAMAKT